MRRDSLALLVVSLLVRAATSQLPPSLLETPCFPLGTDEPLALGDVNGDGHLDLVVHRNAAEPGRLAVLLGDGLGGFGLEVQSSVAPAHPKHFCTGDFDSDGRSDVAFAEFGPVVQVWHGAPDGKLVHPQFLPLAQAIPARLVTAIDVNGDRRLDLVASQWDSSRLSLLLADGSGGFVSPATQLLAVPSAKFIGGGDLDGDGDGDLVVLGGPFSSETAVLWGHGDGQFDAPETVAGTRVQLVGDFDGDGRDDIFARSTEPEPAEAYWSWQPTLGFVATPVETSLPVFEQSAATQGDLDRDGDAELLLAYEDGQLDILDGPAGGPLAVTRRFAFGTAPVSVHVADLNADGDLDLIGSGAVATVLLGQGDGGLEPSWRVGAMIQDFAVGDVTGDGHPDVVVVLGADEPAHVFPGRLGGGLGPPESIDAGPAPTGVRLFDATGDGRLDIVAGGGTTLAVAAAQPGGGFEPPLLTPLDAVFMRMVPVPLDGDGLPDLAVQLNDVDVVGSHYIRLLHNSGGVFSEVDAVDVAAGPTCGTGAFDAGDLDGDGDADLLVYQLGGTACNDGMLRAFFDEPGGFVGGPPMPGQIGYGFFGFMFLDDVEPDGDLDLVYRPSVVPDVQLRLNDGTGSFSAPSSIGTVAGSIRHALIEDLDGDGRPDLLVCATTNSPLPPVTEVSVAPGLGGGAFGTFTAWITDAQPFDARAADLDGDGATDVVLELGFTQLLVLENGHGPWTEHGHSLAGPSGFSRLEGIGQLNPGSTAMLRASHGLPGAPAMLVAGPAGIFAPFKGGVLVPLPTLVQPLGPLDGEGALQVSGRWPAGMAPGASLFMQVWRPEPGAPSGFAATTAIEGTTP